MTTMPYIPADARLCLERLAAHLPASRFALVLTVGGDDPAILTIVPRDNPSRPMDVAVLDTIDGPYFAAYTEGGRLSLNEVTSPGSTAEAIEWTLMGR